MLGLTIGDIASRLQSAYQRIKNTPCVPPENNDSQPNVLINLSTDEVDESVLKDIERESAFWRIDRKPEGLTRERVKKISGTIDLKIRNAINSGKQNNISPHADWGGYYAHLGKVSVRQDDDYFLRVYRIYHH